MKTSIPNFSNVFRYTKRVRIRVFLGNYFTTGPRGRRKLAFSNTWNSRGFSLTHKSVKTSRTRGRFYYSKI